MNRSLCPDWGWCLSMSTKYHVLFRHQIPFLPSGSLSDNARILNTAFFSICFPFLISGSLIFFKEFHFYHWSFLKNFWPCKNFETFGDPDGKKWDPWLKMTTWSLLTLTELKQNKNSISFMTEAFASHDEKGPLSNRWATGFKGKCTEHLPSLFSTKSPLGTQQGFFLWTRIQHI